MKRPAHKKKTTASSDPAPDDDVGNLDLEVELDSLGLFFIRVIADDICQDDAEASHADVVEVIISLPIQKLCLHKKSARKTGK